VQCREEPRQLQAGVIPVDGADDLEQARPSDTPRDQDERVSAARGHLGQERDSRLARERLQDADLVQDEPRGGLGPRELHDVVLAEGRARHVPSRVIAAGQVRDGDGQPAQPWRDGPQCLRHGGRRWLRKPRRCHSPTATFVPPVTAITL
jgi:hypothetical protein